MSTKTVKIGVFLTSSCQLLDTASVDVLGSMSKEYLSQLDFLPAHVAKAAPDVVIHYISVPGISSLELTTHLSIVPSHDTRHPDVQPGKLDVLFIPGPDPKAVIGEEARAFVRGHFESGSTDILSVCTGIYVCGQAGVLEGKTACGPRGLQTDIKKQFPGVKLVGEKYRWIQDGNLWSSGGVTNGNDLMAAYARSGKHFPAPVAEIGCKLTEVGDRAQVYAEGQVVFTLGVMWQLVKAWFVGGKTKSN